MTAIAIAAPLAAPKKLPVRDDIELHTSPAAAIAGVLVIAGVLAFFVVFR